MNIQSISDLTLHLAHVDQAPQLVGLLERAYRGEASRIGWTSEADLIDGRRTSMDDVLGTIMAPDKRMIVALAGSEIVGCAIVSLHGEEAEFGKFAVEPTQQGRGLGKLLLARAEHEAVQAWGVARMTMNVIRQRHDLIAFYRRRGYEPTGRYLAMADIHHAEDMTIGHDLVLDEFAKALKPAA
jgi:GNAT superfamily N-acetyltransferase